MRNERERVALVDNNYHYTKIIVVRLSVRAGGDRKPFDPS